MALPPGVLTTLLTFGPAVSMLGTPLDMTITVTPSKSLKWVATGQPLVALTETSSGAAGVQGSVAIPRVGQPGFIDGTGNEATAWGYIINVTYKNAGGGDVAKSSTAFTPGIDQVEVDLDLLPDNGIVTNATAPIPAVTSVNGQTGAVTVADLSSVPDPSAQPNGRVLTTVDGDTAWAAPTGGGDPLPGGASNGQVLTYVGTAPVWADAPDGIDTTDRARLDKVDGIAPGATANATNAQLRDRGTHTGASPISSITDLASSLAARPEASAVAADIAAAIAPLPTTAAIPGLVADALADAPIEMASVDGLTSALGSKAPVGHTHPGMMLARYWSAGAWTPRPDTPYPVACISTNDPAAPMPPDMGIWDYQVYHPDAV